MTHHSPLLYFTELQRSPPSFASPPSQPCSSLFLLFYGFHANQPTAPAVPTIPSPQSFPAREAANSPLLRFYLQLLPSQLAELLPSEQPLPLQQPISIPCPNSKSPSPSRFRISNQHLLFHSLPPATKPQQHIPNLLSSCCQSRSLPLPQSTETATPTLPPTVLFYSSQTPPLSSPSPFRVKLPSHSPHLSQSTALQLFSLSAPSFPVLPPSPSPFTQERSLQHLPSLLHRTQQ